MKHRRKKRNPPVKPSEQTMIPVEPSSQSSTTLGCCPAATKSKSTIIAKFLATDLKPGTASVQGFAPFTALATFALSQSVALTAVAKGRGQDTVVLIIYAITTFATVLWIWWMLRSSRTQTVAGKSQEEAYFDLPTMRFGQVTLAWTIILGVVLGFLGANELLPNQTNKVEYKERTNKRCIGRVQLGNPQTVDSRLERLPLLEWLMQATNPASERLVIIQQSDPFTDNYFDFSLDITCKATYQFSRRMAFLINSDGPLRMRPLQFLESGQQPTNRATIIVHDAEPNDRLLVLAFVSNKDEEGRFDKTFENYEFRLAPFVPKPVDSTPKEKQK